MRWRAEGCLALLIVVAAAAPAAAGKVTVEGNASVSKLPDVLRAHFTVHIRSVPFKQAVPRLAERKRAVHKRLIAAGAIGPSIRFGDTTISELGKASAKRMLPFGGEDADAVSISTMVTSDWPLKARSPDELAAVARSLRRHVRAIAVADVKADSAYVPALSSASIKSRSPSLEFEFIAWLGEREHVELLRRAFDDARRRAARVAVVTQQTLGSLLDVNASAEIENPPQRDRYGIPRSPAAAAIVGENRLEEATAPTAGMLVFRARLRATFSLSAAQSPAAANRMDGESSHSGDFR